MRIGKFQEACQAFNRVLDYRPRDEIGSVSMDFGVLFTLVKDVVMMGIGGSSADATSSANHDKESEISDESIRMKLRKEIKTLFQRITSIVSFLFSWWN